MSLVPDPSLEVPDFLPDSKADPDPVPSAFEFEIGPLRRSDDAHFLDLNRSGVEQVALGLRALLGEPCSGLVDLGSVDLVRELVNEFLGVGCEIACEDDDVCFRVVCSGTTPPCLRWRPERIWIFISCPAWLPTASPLTASPAHDQ